MWAVAEVDATEGDTVKVPYGEEKVSIYFNFYGALTPVGTDPLVNRQSYDVPEPESGDFAARYRWTLEGLFAQDPRIAAGHVYEIRIV